MNTHLWKREFIIKEKKMGMSIPSVDYPVHTDTP